VSRVKTCSLFPCFAVDKQRTDLHEINKSCVESECGRASIQIWQTVFCQSWQLLIVMAHFFTNLSRSHVDSTHLRLRSLLCVLHTARTCITTQTSQISYGYTPAFLSIARGYKTRQLQNDQRPRAVSTNRSKITAINQLWCLTFLLLTSKFLRFSLLHKADFLFGFPHLFQSTAWEITRNKSINIFAILLNNSDSRLSSYILFDVAYQILDTAFSNQVDITTWLIISVFNF
jgi:hypothetical protein